MKATITDLSGKNKFETYTIENIINVTYTKGNLIITKIYEDGQPSTIQYNSDEVLINVF